MTDLSDLLMPELVAVDLSAASRKSLFPQLGGLMATARGRRRGRPVSAVA